MFRYYSGLILALFLLAKSSVVAAQLGAVPVNITLRTEGIVTVTQNGSSIECNDGNQPQWERTQVYRLAPVEGYAVEGHLQWPCGDIVVLVDHVLTTVVVDTEGTGGHILHPSAYSHRLVVSVQYGPSEAPITVLDRTLDKLWLEHYPSGSHSLGYLSSDFLQNPGVRIEAVADAVSYEFGG
jgi:hypothetical protein